MFYMHNSEIKNLVIHLKNVFKNIPLSAISGYELFYGLGSSLLLNTSAWF